MPANADRKYRQTVDYVEDFPGADVPRDLLQVAIASQDSPDNLSIDLTEIGGTAQTPGDVVAVLESAGGDEFRMRMYAEDTNGNVAEVQAEELGTTVSGSETALVTKFSEALETVANTEARVSLYAEDSAGTLTEIQQGGIDTSLSGTETGVVTSVSRALQEVGGTEIRSRVHDAAGAQIDPLARQDTAPVTGSTSAAGTDVALVLGDYRKDVDFFVDVSGSATLTVEARTSGGTWRPFDTVSYDSAATEVEQYSTAYAEIRASVDQNLTTLEGTAKGV